MSLPQQVVNKLADLLSKEGPDAALDELFWYSETVCPWEKNRAVASFTTPGVDGCTYGSFLVLRREDLVGRRYKVGVTTRALSIHWLDRLFVPWNRTVIPLPTIQQVYPCAANSPSLPTTKTS